jgi:hypothetical protein
VYQSRGLLLYGADDLRVAVSRRADGDARVTVEERVAVNVLDPDARGVVYDELVGGARVRGRDPLRIRRDYLLSLRAGQFRSNLRSPRGSYY